jgi:hypothetical protein
MSNRGRAAALLSRAILSLRMDGLRLTLRRARTHLFGVEHYYVFVRHLEPPPEAVEFPIEANGIVVRAMTERDRADILIRRREPRAVQGPCEGMVATRDGRIVGAAWYADTVTAKQPWYRTAEPHLILPARLTASMFVVPGDKGAAWALTKSASDRLASAGVRSIVGLVGVGNARSVVMSRLLGAKMVARVSVRYRLGRRLTTVETVATDSDTGIATVPQHAGETSD